MAIDAETQRMMNNWARWKLGGASIELAMSSAYVLEGRGRREAVSTPLMNGEAIDVDRAVAALPGELFHVIEQCWLKRGTVQQKAKRCRCALATYYRRLEHAHERVRLYLRQLRRRSVEIARRVSPTMQHVEAPLCDRCKQRHWLRLPCIGLEVDPVVKTS